MEDLSINSTTVPMIPGFNNQQILSIVEELAKFHCISWLHPKWKNSFTKEQLSTWTEETIVFFKSVGNELITVKI